MSGFSFPFPHGEPDQGTDPAGKNFYFFFPQDFIFSAQYSPNPVYDC